ncbi:hypothetical protein SGL43_00298 [Streptomyces globisporus]|uniref:Uncharacterized protein n=1 Tax=Streptomyces globisporus TaxID=1908 RepID=A0ABM9GPR0_STRGL|nr:hypothetical protein SGL43_00298 [Streptomyces globisporus]
MYGTAVTRFLRMRSPGTVRSRYERRQHIAGTLVHFLP